MSKNNKLSRRLPRRVMSVKSGRPIDPVITATRFAVPSTHIPSHIAAPSIQRVVRLVVVLTSGIPNFIITYDVLARQDGLDYLGTLTSRYVTMRVTQARFWAESPNSLSVSQSPYGLIVVESDSSFSVRDRPTTGARLNAIGLRFPFSVRSNILNVSSATAICQISCDVPIAATTNFVVTVDVTCEFFA